MPTALLTPQSPLLDMFLLRGVRDYRQIISKDEEGCWPVIGGPAGGV
jgi:hypothetical protein